MSTEEIEKKLIKLFSDGGRKSSASGKTGLFIGENGVLDSVTALSLILAIEEEFKITVEDEEIQDKNFGNLEALVQFVDGKLKNSPTR